jgi:hypothetical protein
MRQIDRGDAETRRIVDLRTRFSDLYTCEALIDLNGEPRKTMADQFATVGKQRLQSRLATPSIEDLRAVGRAIRVQPGLSPS